jgi:hypothetical protein
MSQQVAKTEVSMSDLLKIIAEQKLALEKLSAEQAKRQTISYKVSEKGALSVYGLGRWPVTLYKTQWLSLLAKADDIRKFMADHADKLASKP